MEVYKYLEEIRFGLLSPATIRKLSVAEIKTPDTYDEDGIPIPSGLMDNRLGTLEPRQRCATCGNDISRCLGHFGHIELASPVIHVSFTTYIRQLLMTTCRICGRILLPAQKIDQLLKRKENIERLFGSVPESFFKDVIRQIRRTSVCPHCNEPQHKIEFVKPTIFYEVPKRGGAYRLTPNEIRSRLERIPDKDLLLLGFEPAMARPEWMILQVLPVPPVCIRPSITLESGIRAEDDLTHKLVDIIRINQRLKENIEIGAPPLIVQDLQELLQYHVTTYFDNTVSGIPPARHRSGRALRTISQRLGGKEGRFRSNLSGKRVDFSARTVISPDPSLEITEVGVPIEIAKRLTVPERVTQQNIREMAKFVINGPDKYPGALYVTRPDGRRLRLEFVADRSKLTETLEPGYIVERHLKDGDIVIINRQPSLHRMSIMAHYAKILPYKTLRLHLCVCPPYNADFDGDEMNLHVPQSEEARAEALLLMSVQTQLLSPRYGGPIIGAIRDFITGAYLLTHRKTLLDRTEVHLLLGMTGYEGPIPKPIIMEPRPLWSGKQIFSLFLPKGFNHVQRANICRQCSQCLYESCPYDAYVVIKNGILKSGCIDKASIGAEKSESVYHRIIKEYGDEEGVRFLGNICRLVNAFISLRGFTYSLDKLDLSEEAKRRIEERVKEARKAVNKLIESYKSGELKALPGQTLEESLEIFIMNELAKARDDAGEIVDYCLGLDNSGVIMTKTGARGSTLNIGQMAACIGQQSIRGKRITKGYRGRTLPHFKLYDVSPEARGFIYSSYRDGLSPTEFFFHAMAGREGLVDTAVRTQQSGYMQRRLINALEHLRVEYDGTVRTPFGAIVQFKYGEDGIDPAKSDHGKVVNVRRLVEQESILGAKGERIEKEYINDRLERLEDKLPPNLIKELKIHLLKTTLTRHSIDKIIEEICKAYENAQVEAGEAVGIVAAQSIGEPGTQMTLRTFHYAGVREQNVTLGLPRIIEIVDARREPSTPIMNVYLKEEYKHYREKATEVAQKLLFTTIQDIASVFIYTGVGIILEVVEEVMKKRGITLEEVEESISRSLPSCSIIKQNKKIIIKPRKAMNLQKLSKKVLSTRIKGVPGISRVLVVEEEGEWVIRTDGSNLSQTFEVDEVDQTRTISNHIHEIAQTLGIEAARHAIIKESSSVLEEQGLDVDIRHVMLVADMMTWYGTKVHQIGRHGISGKKVSVLAKAAFELTVPTLIDAAVKSLSDSLSGIAENIIVGKTVPVGTGIIDLFMTLSKRGGYS